MNILIFMKMSDKKVIEKLNPIAHLDFVEGIYVIRNKINKMNNLNPKIQIITPPEFIQKYLILVELFRIIAGFFIILTKKIDLLMSIYFYLNGFYIFIFSKIFKIKTIHNLVGEDLFKILESKFSLNILRKGDFIVCRGEITKQLLLSYNLVGEKIATPPNVYEFREYQETEKKYDFIFIGSFVKKKRIDDVLNALSVLKSISKYKFRMAFVGDGPFLNEMKKKSESLNLNENCDFVGYIQNVESIILQSKTLVLVSEKEGLPMVLIETMSYGLPAIVSNNADIPTIAINGYNSFVVDVGDILKIADCMFKILDNEDLYRELSTNSLKIREKASEFSSENISKIWNQIFKQLGLIEEVNA